MFQKITKAKARKLFAEGEPIYLCPCKMRPDGPFSSACLTFKKEYVEAAERYRENPYLWKGDVEKTAWNLMYQNWLVYNSSRETGYYPAYYVEVQA